MAIKLLNFQLRENNPYDNPDYKYELDIDTDDVKLISQIIKSTLLVETDNETGVTLYSNNKQELLAEKQVIEQLFSDPITDKPAPSTHQSKISPLIHPLIHLVVKTDLTNPDADVDIEAFSRYDTALAALQEDLKPYQALGPVEHYVADSWRIADVVMFDIVTVPLNQ